MAGGNLSPRQKMINLMYLVFIAMLALQMSKEVLTAFGYLNERLTTFNVSQVDKNELMYSGIQLKASEQEEKFGDENEKAQKIKSLSQELFDHIAGIKELLLTSVEDTKDYETMDKPDVLDLYLYQKGEVSENGQAFLDAIEKYRTNLVEILGSKYPEVSQSVVDYFVTKDVTDGEGITKDWIDYNFVGFPAVASLTKLTLMQTDIRSAESNVLNAMLGVQLSADAGISASTYKTIFMPSKSSFFPGENVTGEIVLGRYDKTLKPSEVVVNGEQVTDLNNGGAVLNFPAGNVGENEIKGKFVFQQDGKSVEIPIMSTYAVVAKPNDAVISADKMNVVYRGLKNPMTISVPGVADNDMKATASGLTKVAGIGKYMMVPGNGKDIRINVQFSLPGGSKGSSSKTYRIKDIPKPMATVRKESGYVIMPKSSINKTTIRVELPDFLFDLEFIIKSFKLKVPGQAAIIVNGNKMNAQAQSAVDKARVGDVISIFDVKSNIKGVALNIKDASPVTIEVQ
jgi:gliding motility-associated protein GldM